MQSRIIEHSVMLPILTNRSKKIKLVDKFHTSAVNSPRCLNVVIIFSTAHRRRLATRTENKHHLYDTFNTTEERKWRISLYEWNYSNISIQYNDESRKNTFWRQSVSAQSNWLIHWTQLTGIIRRRLQQQTTAHDALIKDAFISCFFHTGSLHIRVSKVNGQPKATDGTLLAAVTLYRPYVLRNTVLLTVS